MRDIILASIALVIIAVAAPKFLMSHIESQQQVVAGKAPARAAPARTRRYASRGEVEFRSAANGHFYLDADIDGEAIAVMVDTGASIVALRESDAERAGIRVYDDEFNVALSTANGTTYAAPVTLASVSVDNIEIRNVRAVVVPDEQLSISLLGTSFLNKLRRFEVSGDTLIFEN
ncbi:MAG: TIGR02281 family clan AA aspartic protease [Hyphomicrobiales bacterium]|nr:TIGR02281 family clan AA aspartic protease [Hyphomicrobiales bacterium]